MPQTLRVCDRRVCPELRRAEIYAIAQKYMRWHDDRSLPRARPVAFVSCLMSGSGCFDPGVGIYKLSTLCLQVCCQLNAAVRTAWEASDGVRRVC